MFEHVPAIFVQLQPFAQILAAVEDSETFRAEHPFVAVGHGEGTAVLLNVEGQGADLLDGIDAEQHASLLATFAETLQIEAQAAGVLNRADRHQAYPWAAGGKQVGFRIEIGRASRREREEIAASVGS